MRRLEIEYSRNSRANCAASRIVLSSTSAVSFGSRLDVVARRLQVGVVAMARTSKALEQDQLELIGVQDLQVLIRRLEKFGQVIPQEREFQIRRDADRFGQPIADELFDDAVGYDNRDRLRAARASDARLPRRPGARSDFRGDWSSEDESSRHNYGSRFTFRNIYCRSDNRCHRIGGMIGSANFGADAIMKKLRRKPTYGAAIRLARIAAGLFSKPYGWSFRAIAGKSGNFRAHTCPLRVGAAQRSARLAWRSAGRSCRHGRRAQTSAGQFDESRGGIFVPGRAAVFLADRAQVPGGHGVGRRRRRTVGEDLSEPELLRSRRGCPTSSASSTPSLTRPRTTLSSANNST